MFETLGPTHYLPNLHAHQPLPISTQSLPPNVGPWTPPSFDPSNPTNLDHFPTKLFHTLYPLVDESAWPSLGVSFSRPNNSMHKASGQTHHFPSFIPTTSSITNSFTCPPATRKYSDLCDNENTLGPVPHFLTRAYLDHTRLALPFHNMVQKGLGQHWVLVEVNNSHLTTLSETHHSVCSNVSYSKILFS